MLIACPAQALGDQTVPPVPGRLLVIGDSLTSGLYASSENNTFASLLATRLGMQLARRHAGTLANAYDVWREVKVWHPEIVIIEVGLNDVSRNVWSPDTWRRNYHDLVADMQGNGATVLVCTTFWAGIGKDHRNYQQYQSLNDDIRQISKETGALLADLWAGTNGCERCVSGVGDDSYFAPHYQGDNFHPNNTGHQLIADAIINALQWRVYIPVMRSDN